MTYHPEDIEMLDGTCWAMDWASPQQRLDDAFKDVGKALRDQIEKEAQAKQYLESLGWVVMRRSPS